MTSIIRPARLHHNARIGICAPSSRITPDKFDAGCAVLQEQGYSVFIHPQTYEATGQIAGGAERRAAALHDLLMDDTLDAVFFACGGHRSAETLPYLNWDALSSAKPKILMGFSDNSVVLNAITARLGWVTVFGPTVQKLAGMGMAGFENLLPVFSLLEGHRLSVPLSYDGPAIQGHIVASTLSMLPLLVGTQNLITLNGAILCVEDCNEELSTIDRLFLLLKQTGAIDAVKAIVCGSFSNLTDTGRPFGFALEDIVQHHAGNTPVGFYAPFGHDGTFVPLPIGVQGYVSANTFELVDEPFI